MMKAPRSAFLAAVLLLRPAESGAQTLSWDPSSARGVQGGTGNWLGANNWQDFRGDNVPWVDSANAVFGATPGTVTVNGIVTAEQLNFDVNGYIIELSSGSLTMAGAAPRIDVAEGQTATIRAPVTGAGIITKSGAGTLAISGSSDNNFNLTVADGILLLGKAETAVAVRNLVIGDGIGAQNSARVVQLLNNQIAFTSTVTIAPDGLWDLGSRSVSISGLTMTGGTVGLPFGVLTLFSGAVTATSSASAAAVIGIGELNLAGGTRVFNIALGPNNSADLQISGTRITNGGMTKIGSGRMNLGQINTFSGPMAINGGVVLVPSVSDSGAIGSLGAGNSISFDGGALSLTGATDSTNRAVTLNPGGGTIDVAISTTTLTMTGAFSGAGGLTKTGPGILALDGTPTYAGNTLISGGTLALNGGIASAAGSLTVSAPATLQARTTVNRAIAGDGTITATGTLIIGDASSANGFAFNGTLNAGSNLVTLADADVAELGVVTTLDADGQVHSPNGAVLGGGESVIVGAAVSAFISGAFTNNGAVNGPTGGVGRALVFTDDVNGTGNYTGRVTFAADFSPGLSAAAVSLQNFQLTPTTTIRIELGGINAGTQFDRLNFTGAGVLDGSLNISLINGFNPQPGNAFTFIQGGSLLGEFDAMSLPPLDPGYAWSYSQTANSATLAVVPEPQLAGLLAIGAFAIAMARRPRAVKRHPGLR